MDSTITAPGKLYVCKKVTIILGKTENSDVPTKWSREDDVCSSNNFLGRLFYETGPQHHITTNLNLYSGVSFFSYKKKVASKRERKSLPHSRSGIVGIGIQTTDTSLT